MKEAQSCDFKPLVLHGRHNFFRSGSLYSSLPGSVFEENTRINIYCTGMDYAPCNGVIEKLKIIFLLKTK